MIQYVLAGCIFNYGYFYVPEVDFYTFH